MSSRYLPFGGSGLASCSADLPEGPHAVVLTRPFVILPCRWLQLLLGHLGLGQEHCQYDLTVILSLGSNSPLWIYLPYFRPQHLRPGIYGRWLLDRENVCLTGDSWSGLSNFCPCNSWKLAKHVLERNEARAGAVSALSLLTVFARRTSIITCNYRVIHH